MRVTDPPDTAVVLDYLADRLAADLDPQAFADLLDSLSWSVDDNGRQIEATRARWLREGDRVRTHVAALMSDAFPGRTREDVVGNLGAAAARFPELRARTDTIIEHWDRTHPEPPRSSPPETAGTPDPGREVDRGAPEVTMAAALAFLAEHRAPNMPPEFMAENLDDLVRCLSAEAAREVFDICDTWSAGGDPWRAAAADGMTVHRGAGPSGSSG
jgi:hypothetical protein